MSLSYLECETDNGPGTVNEDNAFVNNLWQQAAGEGVSVFVAAGDNGAAGCDDFNTATFATTGIAANALASTPYDVGTGGTDFLDTAEGSLSTYWSATNDSAGGSAKSYIPEMPWNDSCASSVLFSYFGAKNAASFCNSTTGSNFLNIVGVAALPASYIRSLRGRRGSSVFRTTVSATCRMFPCLPRTGFGAMQFSFACQTRLNKAIRAISHSR